MSAVYNGVARMPVTIRAIVGKGWGQGPQHTKSLHTWFAHVPGLQVVMSGSPADAKGLLLSSIMSNDPTIFIEGRGLYSMREDVPDEPYFIRLGDSLIRRQGSDITLVVFGSMVPPALTASEELARSSISVEIIDMRCLMPLDLDRVVASVKKTGRSPSPSLDGGCLAPVLKSWPASSKLWASFAAVRDASRGRRARSPPVAN